MAWTGCVPPTCRTIASTSSRKGGKTRRPHLSASFLFDAASSPRSRHSCECVSPPILINIIPPQKSGALAEAAGLTDATLWCPVEDRTFSSTQVADIHVIGDSAASGLPKSATSGNAGAKVAALAMAETFLGNQPTDPVFINTCYARMQPDYAIGIVDVFGLDATGKPVIRYDGAGTTPLGASLRYHAEEASQADKWFKSLVADTFS